MVAMGGRTHRAGIIGLRRIGAGFWILAASAVCCRAEALAVDQEPAAVHREAAELARKYVERTVETLEIEAQNRFREAEIQRLGLLSGHGLPGVLEPLASLDSDLRQSLSALLEANNQPGLTALETASEQSQARRRQLVDRWRSVRTAAYDERLELFEIQATKQIAGQLASLLSVDNRWFWLCGLVAVASLVLVATHERRHELRRRLNGGRARAMGLSKVLAALALMLAIVTLTTFIFGDRVYHWLLSAGTGAVAGSREELLALDRAAVIERKAAAERQSEIAPKHQKALEHWQARPGAAEMPLLSQARQARGALEKLAVNLAVEAEVASRLQTDLNQAEQLRGEVAANAVERNVYHRRKQWIRGGLGLGLLGLAGGGGVFFRRGVRRRLGKTSNTCPLCLGEGTFEPLDGQTPGGGAAGHVTLDMVQCKNVISEHPYEECEFTFMSMYREIAKLCFPTLGIPQAGKTHWLAMVYRELNRGNYPEVVQFERIKSASSDEFDLLVDEILNKKLGPMATQVGRIPHPLVFNFLDRDRFGASNILVNIFDYSGEVIRSQTIEDRQRQRALDGDGFFFFLDPTEPSETQSQALAGFREDLRRIKGLKAGKQVHIPVALCVSKIDLMVDEPYADPNGGGVIDHFYRDLGEIGWEMDLKSIEARSRRMAQLRDTVWPGWQIERQIDDLFGGRFMFFPLTPVGLDGAGQHDLSRRTIAPIGLLDPLLWLLHMNGYPVLK